MKDAYSLVHCKNIFADSSEYRENAHEQLTCPVCFEPVFKKEKWVPLKKSETHFFSHYSGDIDSCSRRSQNEVISSDSKDANKRMQSLLAFNEEFRKRIKLASHLILSKKNLSKMDSAYEYAERISKAEINLTDLRKISKKIESLLGLPIFETIDESLVELEVEITPIYLHLTGNYGLSNMTYLSAIVLICTYQNSHSNIEDMILKKTLNSHANLDSTLLGYSTLLLAEYVHAKSNDTKILTRFINKFEKKDSSNISNVNSDKQKEFNPIISPIESKDHSSIGSKKIGPITSSYHKCPQCQQVSYLDDDSIVGCLRCSNVFKTSPQGLSIHPNTNIGFKQNSKNLLITNEIKVIYKNRVKAMTKPLNIAPSIISANPYQDKVDQPMKAANQNLLHGTVPEPIWTSDIPKKDRLRINMKGSLTSGYHRCPNCMQFSLLEDARPQTCPKCKFKFRTSVFGKKSDPSK